MSWVPYNETYYSEISIFEDNEQNNLLLNAQIYINENNYCEGIVSNDNDIHFIFGYFKKFDSLNLYEITNDNQIKNYVAKKTYLQYDGTSYNFDKNNYSLCQNVYAKVIDHDIDPRDWNSYDPLPRDVFIEKLGKFKEKFLKDEIKSNQYKLIMKILNDKFYNNEDNKTLK